MKTKQQKADILAATPAGIRANKKSKFVRCALCCVVLTCLLVLSACGAETAKPSVTSPEATAATEPSPVSLAFGSTGGNLLNGGSWCFKENVLYGIQNLTGSNVGIYAQSEGENKKIAETIASQINVADGFLYYLSYPKGLLYKVPVDASTDPVKLSDVKMLFMLVADDSIYYTLDSNAKLYTMKTDGTENTLISDGKCYDLGGIDNLIYYTDTKRETFCMFNTQTGSTATVPMSERGYAQVMGGKIYYQNEKDGKKLYSCNPDGSDNKVLFDKAVSAINATETYIYFANDSDHGKVYRVRADGTELMKIADVKAEFINVCGEDIYIVNNLKTATLYKIDDSGQLIKLE